jgi:hypothetical protein
MRRDVMLEVSDRFAVSVETCSSALLLMES